MNRYVIYMYLFFWVMIFNYPAYSQEEKHDDGLKPLGFIEKDRKYQLSMYALASNPHEYDQKQVFVTGYVSYSYGLRVFTDKSSCIDSLIVNSIGVNVSVETYERFKSKYTECKIFNVFGKFVNINEYGKGKFEKLTIGDIDPVSSVDIR